jgi:hypothetical protein
MFRPGALDAFALDAFALNAYPFKIIKVDLF